MGNGASSTRSARPPDGVTEICDSLYKLSGPDGNAEVDIVFFHGLQVGDYAEAYWKTWCRDENNLETLWPRSFLGRDFPNARILSVCLDTCARRTPKQGRLEMYLLAENLVTILLSIANVGGGDRPVILVGHSLGGLIIKNFILMAEQKRRLSHEPSRSAFSAFLDRNLAGVFYYATPSGGSEWAKWMSRLPGASTLVAFLRTLGTEAGRLNSEFQIWRKNPPHQIPVQAIRETLPTVALGIGANLVNEASARMDTDELYNAPDDHITVCKPMKKTEMTYMFLHKFIQSSLARKGCRLTSPLEDCT